MNHSTRYVPVLRHKAAEREALLNLVRDPQIKQDLVSPVIELVPNLFAPKKSGKVMSIKEVSIEIADQLLDCWGYENPLFIDTWLIPNNLQVENGYHLLQNVFEHAGMRNIQLIPITGIDSSRDSIHQKIVLSIVRGNSQGLGIRILVPDLFDAQFNRKLQELLRFFKTMPEHVDLLIDYQYVGDPKINIPNLSQVLSVIPYLPNWKTLTVLMGAFPPDLTAYKKNDSYLLSRKDWLTWRNHSLCTDELPRIPDYGDYTIQHPHYKDQREFGNPSASIRYTSPENWLLMRGESLRQGTKFKQYPAQAALLCERPEYCGYSFSCGDKYIYDMGQELQKLSSTEKISTGTPRTWLQAGINHHMVFVMKQLSNLA